MGNETELKGHLCRHCTCLLRGGPAERTSISLPMTIVYFIFLSEVLFPFTVIGQENSDSSLSTPKLPHHGPILKGQRCPGLLQAEGQVTWGVLPPHQRPSLQRWAGSDAVSLRYRLPRSGTTAGLAVEECFVPALLAWASFFRPGMRKTGKTYLYNAEPTWGAGHWHGDFCLQWSTRRVITFQLVRISVFRNPRWGSAEASGALSAGDRRHGETKQPACGHPGRGGRAGDRDKDFEVPASKHWVIFYIVITVIVFELLASVFPPSSFRGTI